MGFLGFVPALAMGTTTASLHEGGKVSDSQIELQTFKRTDRTDSGKWVSKL